MPIASISTTSLRKDGMVRRNLVPARPPTHPQAILRQDILQARGMSVADAAKALGISRQQHHQFSRTLRRSLPRWRCGRGEFGGNGPELWLRMQVTYDVWHARREMTGTLDHMPTVKAEPNMQARASECMNGDGW
jgi:antitoxin HigA-1